MERKVNCEHQDTIARETELMLQFSVLTRMIYEQMLCFFKNCNFRGKKASSLLETPDL